MAYDGRMTGSARQARPRLVTSGSFHAGDIFPSFRSFAGSTRRVSDARSGHNSDSDCPVVVAPIVRRSSSAATKYLTFPSPPSDESSESATTLDGEGDRLGHVSSYHHSSRRRTPLPIKQIGLIALLALAEQTALNSLSPYLPTMVRSFDEIAEDQMGLYVGLLASVFALAQLTTNLFWGYLSDAIGRKPVMLLGTFLLMVCFCFFGFCTTYWQVVIVHVAMGLLNGNAAIVPTCLGEVTDRSNQSSAFTWLPAVYSLGSITGPALGGLLAGNTDRTYPFLAPNISSAVLLGLSVLVTSIFLDETLDGYDRRTLPPSLAWIDTLRKWCRPCFSGSPTTTEVAEQRRSGEALSPLLGQHCEDSVHPSAESLVHAIDNNEDEGERDDVSSTNLKLRPWINPKTVTLLSTYLVFQLANIGFNSLYPIFSAAPLPTGRELPPGEIGLLLSFAGLATIAFQITIFQPLKSKMGNLGIYRGALFGLALSMLLMPWVSKRTNDHPPPFGVGSNTAWLDAEMATVLVIKSVCAVGGLSSVMLLINNSCPSNESLGTLNGIAQTLSAAGRSVGPFLSGALFSISTSIRPKGELLAWYVFGGIATLGGLLGLFVVGQGLESEDWEGHDEGDEDEP